LKLVEVDAQRFLNISGSLQPIKQNQVSARSQALCGACQRLFHPLFRLQDSHFSEFW